MRFVGVITLFILLFSTPVYAGDSQEGGPPSLTYYEVKPSLVANLKSGGQYIRTDIQLMTQDESFKDELMLHGPAIRHTLLMLLSDQDGRALKTAEGKEDLRKTALAQISSLMKDLSGKDSVKALFFTTFFVQ